MTYCVEASFFVLLVTLLKHCPSFPNISTILWPLMIPLGGNKSICTILAPVTPLPAPHWIIIAKIQVKRMTCGKHVRIGLGTNLCTNATRRMRDMEWGTHVNVMYWRLQTKDIL